MLYQIAMNDIMKTSLGHLAVTDQIDAYGKRVEIQIYILCNSYNSFETVF